MRTRRFGWWRTAATCARAVIALIDPSRQEPVINVKTATSARRRCRRRATDRRLCRGNRVKRHRCGSVAEALLSCLWSSCRRNTRHPVAAASTAARTPHAHTAPTGTRPIATGSRWVAESSGYRRSSWCRRGGGGGGGGSRRGADVSARNAHRRIHRSDDAIDAGNTGNKIQ